MGARVQCSKCGEKKWMRTEILARNWRNSGLTRQKYLDTYLCSRCRKKYHRRSFHETMLNETIGFQKFSSKLRGFYKVLVTKGMTPQAINEFRTSVNTEMRKNRIGKYEFIVENGILQGIKLPDFPIFNNVEVGFV